MPYLPPLRKKALDDGAEPQSPGDLTYLVTMDALRYLGTSPDFARYAETIGALEAAKMELYRRALAKYEDAKIIQYGDVYPEIRRGDS